MSNHNYDVVITQLSEMDAYCWALRRVLPYQVLAISKVVEARCVIERQAQEIADEFGLVVMVEER